MKKLDLLMGTVSTVTSDVADRMEIVRGLVGDDLRNKEAKELKASLGINSFKELDSVKESKFLGVVEAYRDELLLMKPEQWFLNKIKPFVSYAYKAWLSGEFNFIDKDGSIIEPVRNNRLRGMLKDLLSEDDIVAHFLRVLKELNLGQSPDGDIESYSEISVRSSFINYFTKRWASSPFEKFLHNKDYVDNLNTIAINLFELFKTVQYKNSKGYVYSFIFTHTYKGSDGKTTNRISVNKGVLVELINHPALKGKLRAFYNNVVVKGAVAEPTNLLKVLPISGEIVRTYKNNTAIYKAEPGKLIPKDEVPLHLVAVLHRLNNMKFTMNELIKESHEEYKALLVEYYMFKARRNHPQLNEDGFLKYIDKDKIERKLMLEDAEASFQSAIADFNRVKSIDDRFGGFYFKWKVGVDNIRLYPEVGAGIALQAGHVKNTMFGSGKPRVLSSISKQIVKKLMLHYRREVNALEKELDSISGSSIEVRNARWEVEADLNEAKIMYIYYKFNYDKASKGLPVDVLVEMDQQASGTAMQTASLGDPEQAKYCGLFTDFKSQIKEDDIYKAMERDGISLIANVDGTQVRVPQENINKLIDMVGVRKLGKLLYTPYQYGSGPRALENHIIEEIKSYISNDNLRFDFNTWEEAFGKHLPSSKNLRDLLSNFSKRMQTAYLEYETPDGVKACITGMMKNGARDEDGNKLAEKTAKTISGRVVTYYFRDVSVKYFGVAHIAAYSHALDAYTLRHTLRRFFTTKGSLGFIIPVHDAFFIHPNDIDVLWDSYSESLRDVVRNGKIFLYNYFKALVNNSDLRDKPEVEKEIFVQSYVQRCYKGEIKPEDITGGLYLG